MVSREFLNTYLKTGFILFNPRDTVSGDFYWAEHLGDNRIIVSVADSTGHGIPGAFLSLLNIAFLKEAVASRNLINTADILNFVRESLINNIKPNELGEGGNDGMDCVLFTINYNTLELELSGAQNSLWIVRALPNTPGEKQIIELKGDKMPVGRSLRAKESFTSQRFQLQKGDVIYASTDGFPDQFGGEKEKKFMHKHLKTLLISISHLHEDEQKQILQNTLDTWRGNLEQVDDITIMGIKL